METIKTDRLILRKPQSCDDILLISLLNDNDVEKFVPNLSFKNIDDIKDFITFSNDLCDYIHDFCIMIEDPKTKNVVGIIDAFSSFSTDDVISVSYAIKKNERGKGYLPEALKAFILYLYTNTDIKAVEFSIREDNIFSLNVMKKLNISHEYKLCNYFYYRVSLKEKPSF